MPIPEDFFRKMKTILENGDKEEIYDLIDNLVHYGWFKRFGEVLRTYKRRFGRDEINDLWFVVYFLFSRMDSRRAYRYANGKGEFYYRAKRIFYEYIGDNPRALKYNILAKAQWQGSKFWTEVREKIFPLYRGRVEDYPGLNPAQEDFGYLSQLAIKSYADGIYRLLKGERDEEYLRQSLNVLNMLISENYDYDLLRLMQVLIPYLTFLGKRGTAERFLDVAINTAKTDKNLYAYTWFKIYSAILRGDDGYLKKMKEKFERRRFLYHTILCRYSLGEDVEDLKEKYWHYHTIMFVNALRGSI